MKNLILSLMAVLSLTTSAAFADCKLALSTVPGIETRAEHIVAPFEVDGLAAKLAKQGWSLAQDGEVDAKLVIERFETDFVDSRANVIKTRALISADLELSNGEKTELRATAKTRDRVSKDGEECGTGYLEYVHEKAARSFMKSLMAMLPTCEVHKSK